MKRIVLTFGLIAGAVLSAMMVITFGFAEHIDFDKGEIIGYTTMVAAFLMVYFGVRSYRDDVLGGTIGFGRAFRVGMLIVLVASTCYVATWQVVYRKMTPDFVEKYAAHELAKRRAEGATEQELAARAAEMAKFQDMYRNPFVNVAMTFLEPLPVGLVMTLLTAAVLARRKSRAPSVAGGVATVS